MSPTAPQRAIPVYDLVGIGFGPSNLALAIAVEEHNGRPSVASPRDAIPEAHAIDDECVRAVGDAWDHFPWHRSSASDGAPRCSLVENDPGQLPVPSARALAEGLAYFLLPHAAPL